MTFRIAIGSDHLGFNWKDTIAYILRRDGHDVWDVGCSSREMCDYPDYAEEVAVLVGRGDSERGILICGTGIGMSIAANKIKGVRAALCHDMNTAIMSRQHNDANVLCMANGCENIMGVLGCWMEHDFLGGSHQMRLDKIAAIEREERQFL